MILLVKLEPRCLRSQACPNCADLIQSYSVLLGSIRKLVRQRPDNPLIYLVLDLANPFHTAGVTGSIPVAPTMKTPLGNQGGFLFSENIIDGHV